MVAPQFLVRGSAFTARAGPPACLSASRSCDTLVMRKAATPPMIAAKPYAPHHEKPRVLNAITAAAAPAAVHKMRKALLFT